MLPRDEDKDLNDFSGNDFQTEVDHVSILETGTGTYLTTDSRGRQKKRYWLKGHVYPGKNIYNIKTDADATVAADKIMCIF